MKKLINIIVLIILNVIFLFIPGTISYLCLTYSDKFINNQFNDVIYTSFIRYVLDYTISYRISREIGPILFINLEFIVISLVFYLIDSKKKYKENIWKEKNPLYTLAIIPLNIFEKEEEKGKFLLLLNEFR